MDTAPFGSSGHQNDGKVVYEILRNDFLLDNGVSKNGKRHPDNHSMTLSRTNHTAVYNEEARLRAKNKLSRNQMMKRGRSEIRLMHCIKLSITNW